MNLKYYSNSLNPKLIKSIQNSIITWYLNDHRDLPWRNTTDPYKIWISEIMLQQTQVNTVIDYFNRFVKHLPTVEALANIDDETLMKLWEGLGYYRRARNLKKAAQMIVHNFEGVLPKEHKSILTLSGIGPYTAGAILSIAYNLPYAAIDGNVIRVYSRLFKIEEEVDRNDIKKVIDELGDKLVSLNNPSAYNQGLMELGALVCTPQNPKCEVCPVIAYCESNKVGIQNQLPRKKPKKKASAFTFDLCLIENDAHLLVIKRPEKGVLGGLWSLPQVERQKNQNDIINWIFKTYALSVKPKGAFQKETHIFTHQKWNMRYKQFEVKENTIKTDLEYRWIPINDLGQLAFPTAYLKILKKNYKF